MILEARNLVKKFGDLTAVDDVSLSIKEGECLALLGPNGAGKTTTVEILIGLGMADQGSVEVFGQSMATNRTEILQQVGVVLQESNLYKKFTVKETLELFHSFYRDPQNVGDVIELLDLKEKQNSRLEHLSGGQKQRLYLGASLINKPKLIFLDEPTTGLDPQSRRSIWKILGEIRQQGAAILLTTHYMEEAEILADQVAIIDRGKIIARNTPKNLISESCGSELLVIDTSANQSVTENLKQNFSWIDHTSIGAEGIEVETTNPVDHLGEIDRFLKNDKSVKVNNIGFRRGSLEDVFLKLTGRSIRDG